MLKQKPKKPERIIVRCASVYMDDGNDEKRFYPANLIEIHRAGRENVYFTHERVNQDRYISLDSSSPGVAEGAKRSLDLEQAMPFVLESPEVITRVLNSIDAIGEYAFKDSRRLSEALAGIAKMVVDAESKTAASP